MLQIGSSGVSSLSRVALVACSQVSFVSVSRLLTSLLEAPLHRQLGSSVIARLPCCPQRMLANSSSSCRSRSTTPPVMAWSAATMRAPGCICTSGVASALRNGPTAVARAHLASGKTLPQRRLQLAASGRQSAVAWGGKLPRRAPVPQLDHGAGSGAGAGGRGGGRIGFSGRSGGAGGGDASSGNGGGGGLWAAYSSLLEAHPLMVKAVTTALLSALGNIICQVAIEHVKELDGRRLGIFTALGFFWVTPCLHFWFGALNSMVTAPGNTGALLRMAADQLGFAPLFVGSMIAILAAIDGAPLDSLPKLLASDLPPAIRANWSLWVPAQFINFRFVPPAYQVLFANVVALAWNVYFSWATRPKTA